jgi:hypothetical protein
MNFQSLPVPITEFTTAVDIGILVDSVLYVGIKEHSTAVLLEQGKVALFVAPIRGGFEEEATHRTISARRTVRK